MVIHGRLAGAVCESRTADGGGDGGDGGGSPGHEPARFPPRRSSGGGLSARASVATTAATTSVDIRRSLDRWIAGSLDRWIADLQAFRSVSVLSRPARMHSTTVAHPPLRRTFYFSARSLFFPWRSFVVGTF